MPQISDLIPSIPLNDGSVIPQLGFGTLSVPPDRESTPANAEITAEVVGLALQAGYRHIDTAQAYGNEAGVGRAIAVSGVPRRELYVTSKLSNSNHRLADVRRSFHKTLEDLGRDQLDLFLIDWPAAHTLRRRLRVDVAGRDRVRGRGHASYRRGIELPARASGPHRGRDRYRPGG